VQLHIKARPLDAYEAQLRIGERRKNFACRANHPKPVKPASRKYSAFAVGQITATSSPHPGPQEGRFAVVTNVGPGCGGRGSVRDERAGAYGEIVWSWRPDAGVKFADLFASDGGKKAGHRGERDISRKTIAQGRPECFR
jgi:hypothetical protein